jgi:hypothetical protein
MERVNDSKGQKPSVRSDFGMCSNGYPFFLFGGMGSKQYNDIRRFTADALVTEWRIQRRDTEGE